MSILEDISAGAEHYTKSERRIADFIINHTLAFTINPIGSVAQELEVSKTTLLRFARKMGFEGYFDFRKQLQKEELDRSTTAERFRQLGDQSDLNCIEKLQTIEAENISQCVKGLDRKEFLRCVDAVVKAGTVYIGGGGFNTYLAGMTASRMGDFGYNFRHISGERGSMVSGLINAQEGDVFIAIDLPEYSRSLEEAAAFARRAQLTVVLVTDYVTCPLVKNADMVFYCDSQTDFLKNSLNVPLFFLNLLIYSVVRRDDEKIMAFFQKKERIRSFEQELL